ncbi:TIGR03564 family F420-dependent LLM class oxidoreductase [Nonomuraea jiangxiensis]|uniref:F420-dependent oxidoreductase, MSMEG_4879 family n=1 Tax=Nonomuraea jiangxiensis TaxID=633440 RepID=A0A1G8BP89_9ACTN|nr:TIGR03564 family F420-dependent LLM class oxidoreductase [Nonomuraea jiangxiensis]SDH34979.1 F420-dependent oxidoreductase, MSMEG_4879 family [Nonomuraea jiangxiensis]
MDAGRDALLGLGVGNRNTVEQRYGQDYARPAHRMREYLRALRPLLRDGEVSFRGETLVADTGGWLARVPGSVPAPPVLVAAMGPAMLRVTGELADGTITWLAGARTIGDHVAPILHAAAEGNPAPQVIASLPVCVTGEPDEARERAAANLAFYLNVPSYRAVLDREGASSPADVAIVGDERYVERQIARLADAGVTHFVASPAGLTTAQERQRTLELLGALSTRGC